MKSILKFLGASLSIITLCAMVGVGAFASADSRNGSTISAQSAEIERLDYENTASVDRAGTEYQLIKQAVIEESGAQPGDWSWTFASIIGRVESDMFPNTVESVLKQKINGRWQFSYMGDSVHAKLSTAQGDAVDAVIFPLWVAYVHGEYVPPSSEVHSFCTPAACAASNAYFGQFEMVHVGEGHQYFAGKPQPIVSKFAPKTTVRPIMRPDSIETAAESARIEAAVMLAQK